MKTSFVRVTACSLSLLLFTAMGYPVAVSAQPIPQGYPAPSVLPQQIDQLLAPIALYPDPLLAQVLMASTYPLEIVEAGRWVQDPRNASLRGDQLDGMLQQQNWDPSVKSLVPFPLVLQMMNSKLEWTQALGNAFLAQQADVMESVQRLRGEAMAAGTLQSTAQETVTVTGSVIVIEPANHQLVYVPYYNSTVVYGRWGYPDYPPVYFSPPPNYGNAVESGVYFGAGFGVVVGLWGWDRWDWGHHALHIDSDQYNRINNYAIVHDNRPRQTGDNWQHDPTRRRGVPYGDPAVRQKFQTTSTGSAAARRDFRGFGDNGGIAGAVHPDVAGKANILPHATALEPRAVPPASASVPAAQSRGGNAQIRPVAPAFSGFGRGSDVHAQSQRGQTSRQSQVSPSPQRAVQVQQRASPPAPQPQRSAQPPPRSEPSPHHDAPPGNGRGERR